MGMSTLRYALAVSFLDQTLFSKALLGGDSLHELLKNLETIINF